MGIIILAVPAVIIFFGVMMGYQRGFGIKTKVPFVFYHGKLPHKYKITLQKHFKYYQSLPELEKIEFERRVLNFIRNKKFIPMHGMKRVTAEMKSLIAASAIQLTFGLDEIYLVHFSTILVFPREYFSMVTGAMHKGEVNAQGVIALSWKDLAKGYIYHNDSYNVGLHEMAHALSLENRVMNQEFGFLEKEKLLTWRELADKEFYEIREGKPTFLRSYATSDRSEFFPVCIEYFFEKPQDFKDHAPDLYKALCGLLNQDPLKMTVSV